MYACLGGPKSLLTLIEPDFPFLADEIAEPGPDMNIKVAAFTVREKSINKELTESDLFIFSVEERTSGLSS